VAKIKKFTTGEKLRLVRRRMGLSQVAFLDECGQTRGWMIAVEADKLNPGETICKWIDEKFSAAEVAPHEQCYIKRERANITQPDLAKKLSCSVQHLRDMEMGRVNASKLRKHWQC
jgi:transcriptional regulator with XRE-family HTH domain